MPTTNQKVGEELIAAVKVGDTFRAALLLERDPVLIRDERPECGAPSALNTAIANRDMAMVDVLLNAGADINAPCAQTNGSRLPLQVALQTGDRQMVEFLLDRGADIDIHTAACLGNIEILRDMLQTHPSLARRRGNEGATPLHYAKTKKVAKLLLKNGADINARDTIHHSTPAQWLIGRTPEVIEYLLKKGAQCDIFLPIYLDELGMLREHVLSEPDSLGHRVGAPPLDNPHEEGEHIYVYTMYRDATALHAAAIFDRPRVAEALMDTGFDPNITTRHDGATPLHLAAWHDHVPIARKLLEVGAQIDSVAGSIEPNTPLGWAIIGGSFRMTRYLIDIGAQVSERHLRDARRGATGEYRHITRVKHTDYQAILKLLRLHQQS